MTFDEETKSLKILLVDDDPVLCQTAVVFLGMAGHKVTVTHGVADAIVQLDRTVFDLAIVDFEMPGASGLEFLGTCRDRGLLGSMPVIMMTSRDDMPVIDRAFEMGASGFTVKPANWRLLEHEARFVLRAARNQRLATASRDEALRLSALKDQLLSLARHELRTPLNAVVGFGRMIAQEAARIHDESIAVHANEVVTAGLKLDVILSDIQIFLDHRAGRLSSNRQAERPAWILDALLADPALKNPPKGLGVGMADEAGDVRIAIDPTQIHDALRRLVINTFRHAAGASKVLITALLDGKGRVILAVTDDGSGIPEADIARCLEPFAQADMSRTRGSEGLGLGLPIARALTEMNGGTFTLSSKPGAGTTAILAFPRAPG